MYCEFCGTSMDEGALLCPVCGNQRREAPARPQRTEVRVDDTFQVMEGPRCPEHEGMPLVGKCPRCGKEVCVRCAPEAARDDFTCTNCVGLTAAHQQAPTGAKCAVHPAAPAAFICSRCGSFACRACGAEGGGAEGLCVRCVGASGQVLARRLTRFVAAVVDTLVILAPPMVVGFVDGFVRAVSHTHGRPTFVSAVEALSWLVGYGVELGAQLRWGQSLGKRLFGIRVVRMSGQPIELWRLIVMRNLLTGLVGGLCLLVPIADALMIFTDDRRCLHDYLGDSKVILDDRGPAS